MHVRSIYTPQWQQEGAEPSGAQRSGKAKAAKKLPWWRKAHKQDQGEGEGERLPLERGQCPLWIARRGDPAPRQRAPRDICPQMLFYTQTYWREGMFLREKRMCRNLSCPPRSWTGDTPDLKVLLGAVGLEALEGQADI